MISSRWRRFALGAVGTALSLIGLWYVIRGVDFKEVLSLVNRIRVLPLILSIALHWGGLVTFRAILVRYLLSRTGKVKTGTAYRAICIGFLANNILPLRIGEAVRIGVVSRGSGTDFAAVTGSLALERMLDMAMVVVIGFIAVQVAPLPTSVVSAAMIVGAGIFLAFIAMIFIARRGLEQRPLGTGRRSVTLIWNLLARFSSGIRVLGTARSTLIATSLSLVIWVFAILSMLARVSSFGLPASLPMVLALLTCLGLGVALPSAPAFVGVYHAAVAIALHDVFGYDKEIAVFFSFYSWIIDVALSGVTGLISLFWEGLSWSDLKISRQR